MDAHRINKVNTTKEITKAITKIMTPEITVIDGSLGEGGGQIFRTALTLSMCLGKAVCIENIRAGRSKPGLLRQHLACLRAATEISQAEVEGDELGSQRVVFKPGSIKAGEYRFVVGTAGSTALIFQTIVMPLLMADAESEVIFEGGTHNSMTPTFDFIEQCFLRQLKAMGCDVTFTLDRHGFYPAGGGAWSATIKPSDSIGSLELMDSGRVLNRKAVALSSKIPAHVGVRELAMVAKHCHWEGDELERIDVNSVGPGNVLSLQVEMEKTTAAFVAFGEKNVSAEKVAAKAIKSYQDFDKAGVPVCEYLADQLVLPMVLGCGGRFRTQSPSLHLTTNIAVVEQLMDANVQLQKISDLVWEVSVQGRGS